jgi:putative endonuclease
MSGAEAERWAARFLLDSGLTLADQNYHSRFGEIDLIMRDGDVLVFVEVRLRSSNRFGGAAASIDRNKQLRIIRTAECYLAGFSAPPVCRFDALLMDDANGRNAQWIRNAFEA